MIWWVGCEIGSGDRPGSIPFPVEVGDVDGIIQPRAICVLRRHDALKGLFEEHMVKSPGFAEDRVTRRHTVDRRVDQACE